MPARREFTAAEMAEVQSMLRAGRSLGEVAAKFGVSRYLVTDRAVECGIYSPRRLRTRYLGAPQEQAATPLGVPEGRAAVVGCDLCWDLPGRHPIPDGWPMTDEIERRLEAAGLVYMAATLAQRDGALPIAGTLALPHTVGEWRPGGREIACMRETFARAGTLPPLLMRIVVLRALRDPEWGAPVFGWAALGHALGVSAPTVRRWHAQGMAMLQAAQEAA